MKACITGASAGLGRALADRLAAAGHELLLIATDERDLAACAADLRLRRGGVVSTLAADLAAADPAALAERILAALGGLDALFLIAGYTDPDDDRTLPDARAQHLLALNGAAPVRLLNVLAEELAARRGVVVAASSVAVMRPRRGNSLYAAAKAGLEFYCEALRHRHAAAGLRVQVYRLGFLSTRMTFGQKLPLPALSAEAAAAHIVRALDRAGGVRYLPAWWAAIGLVLRSLPWFVFRRLKF